MAKDPVNNLNVLSQDLLLTPQQVKRALPHATNPNRSRNVFQRGPCRGRT
jgi:hypothetical protein